MRERVREKPAAIKRYRAVKSILQQHLSERFTSITARNALSAAAEATNPPVWKEYWEHVLLAPALTTAFSRSAHFHGIPVNPSLVIAYTYLHDVGRMVSNEYLHNDNITARLLRDAGVKDPSKHLPSTRALMEHAEKMDLSEAQLKLDDPLTPGQTELVDQYVDAQTPCQRIINIADNLGKKADGKLFTMEKFAEYLRGQETRYTKHSPWGAAAWSTVGERRAAGAVLQWHAVDKSMAWLKAHGVEVDAILDALKYSGPSFSVHGSRRQIQSHSELLKKRHFDVDNDKSINLYTARGWSGKPYIWVMDPDSQAFTSYKVLPE